MITGAHAIIYSSDAEADRAFLRDILGFAHVDAGGGWLIFQLPPAEAAVHPTDATPRHELYLMCDDLEATLRELGEAGVVCHDVCDEGWGLLTHIELPSGASLGLYEPRHTTAHSL